jgi:hypothetical protein
VSEHSIQEQWQLGPHSGLVLLQMEPRIGRRWGGRRAAGQRTRSCELLGDLEAGTFACCPALLGLVAEPIECIDQGGSLGCCPAFGYRRPTWRSPGEGGAGADPSLPLIPFKYCSCAPPFCCK